MTKISVALLTPYLYKSFQESGFDEATLKVQQEQFGYNPNNFSGTKTLQVGNLKLDFQTMESASVPHPACCDFAIAGNTRQTEGLIDSCKGTGLIVARYSISYGHSSDSGRMPEDTGYALDVFKDIRICKAMLNDKNFLEAILQRDAKAIRQSVDSLNTKLEFPIIITPYLEQALSLKTCKKGGECQVHLDELARMLAHAAMQASMN